MERFFIFDKFNTWYDWRLVLTSKDLTPPEAKTNYVSIDGMSGSLDLSESLTGEITYEDRTMSASFWTSEGSRKDRERLLRDIVAVLHGRKIKIIDPDDPEHYLYGRVQIKSQTNNLAYAEFTIEAICDPWKYALAECERKIEVDKVLTDTNLVLSNNGVKTVCPLITVTGQAFLKFGEKTVYLMNESRKFSDLKLVPGVNVVAVSGIGSITFTYREADL